MNDKRNTRGTRARTAKTVDQNKTGEEAQLQPVEWKQQWGRKVADISLKLS